MHGTSSPSINYARSRLKYRGHFIQLLPTAFILFSTLVCDDLKTRQNTLLIANELGRTTETSKKGRVYFFNALASAPMWKSLFIRRWCFPSFLTTFILYSVYSPRPERVSYENLVMYESKAVCLRLKTNPLQNIFIVVRIF